MMVALLRQQGDAAHKAEGLNEIIEEEVALQRVVHALPGRQLARQGLELCRIERLGRHGRGGFLTSRYG